MKNNYEIRGDTTAIFIKRRNGQVLEALIDTEDLPRVCEYSGSWCVYYDRHIKSFYVHGKLGNKWPTLHRWILNFPPNSIDHINHNTLNNKRSNLAQVTNAENSQNKVKANRNNNSGVLGVSWHSKNKKWQAYIIRINGKNIYLGIFNDIDHAIKARKQAEETYFSYKQKCINRRDANA